MEQQARELLKNAQGALKDCLSRQATVWINPELASYAGVRQPLLSAEDIRCAQRRLQRFAPLLSRIFSDVSSLSALASPLRSIDRFFQARAQQESQLTVGGTFLQTDGYGGAANAQPGNTAMGSMFLKMDGALPIAGSVKVQGALYRILSLACSVAQQETDFDPEQSDPLDLMSEPCRNALGKYQIHVASTGNLGLSIGLSAVAFGFQTYVHLSGDTAQWKRDVLAQGGVRVKEYAGSYEEAENGCLSMAAAEPRSIVVRDDSLDFLLGYAAGAASLQEQLAAQNIVISKQQPLFVYIPCGGGGAPTGICYGLKLLFGDMVHVFFCEPVDAACMLLGMSSGLYEGISLPEVGLLAETKAEGLSVGRASSGMGQAMRKLLSGIITIPDDTLLDDLRLLYATENIFVEPASALSLSAAIRLPRTAAGKAYLEQHQLAAAWDSAIHVAWDSGGGFIPETIRRGYLERS